MGIGSGGGRESGNPGREEEVKRREVFEPAPFCSLTTEYHCYELVGGHTSNFTSVRQDGGAEISLQERPNNLGEFDPGSERTLAACLTHASRTRKSFGMSKVAHG